MARLGYARVVALCVAATVAACAAAFLILAKPVEAAHDHDTTPPEVVKWRPAHGETGVDRDRNVFVTFSEKMDPNTLNRKTLRLFLEGDPGCPSPIHCGYPRVRVAISYDAKTKTAKLNPRDRLPKNAMILIYVQGAAAGDGFAVADLAGNEMFSSYTMGFHTGRT